MYRLYLDTLIKGKHDFISRFQNIYCMTRSDWMRSQTDFWIILISKQSKWKEYKLSRSTKNNNLTCMPSEDSDQPGIPASLIRFSTLCFMDSMLLHADSKYYHQTRWMRNDKMAWLSYWNNVCILICYILKPLTIVVAEINKTNIEISST